MKYLLGLFLTLLAIASPSSVYADVPDHSPNLIPAECKETAMRFIIAGKDEYDSDRLGARLWSIARLEKAIGHNADENGCLNKIWEQANKDESDYWKHIGKRFNCLDSSGELPETAPAGCPNGKFLDIANNLRFLSAAGAIHEAVQNGSSPGHCIPRTEPTLTGTASDNVSQGLHIAQLASQKGAEEHRDETVDTHMNRDFILLGSDEVALSDAAEIQTCRESARDDKGYLDESKLQAKYQSEEYKKSHPNEGAFHHVVDDIADCGAAFVKNFFQSIWDDIWGLLKLIWKAGSAAVMGPIHLVQAEIKIVKALCNGGSLGAMVRQEWSDGVSMKKKLMDYLNQAYVALKTKLAAEYTQFGCFNQKGNTEKVCSIVGYMGPDIIMLIPGFQELAIAKLSRLEELGSIGSAIRKARIGTEFVVHGVTKIATAPIKLVGRALAYILKLPMKMKWVRDIASGFKVAVFGDEVVLQDIVTHEFYKPNPSVKERIMAALDRKFLKKAPVLADGTVGTQSLGQRAYKRISAQEGRNRALAANAEHAAKNVAELPKSYLVLDSAETHVDPNLIDIGSQSFQDALAKERKAAAEFLDLTPAPLNGANYRYVVKDAEVSEPLYRVQTIDKNYNFQTEGLLRTPKDALGFPVYVDVNPEKLAKSLPEIMKIAKKSGTEAIQVAGDSTTMVSGQRVTVYFQDPYSAKNFMKNISAKSSMGAVRDASLKSSVLKAAQKVVAEGMIARCSGAHDHQCYCHYYTDVAGLNPQNGQAIELSPYRCSSDADAMSSLDEAVKIYLKDHPPGSAPAPGAMPAFKPEIDTTQ